MLMNASGIVKFEVSQSPVMLLASRTLAVYIIYLTLLLSKYDMVISFYCLTL